MHHPIINAHHNTLTFEKYIREELMDESLYTPSLKNHIPNVIPTFFCTINEFQVSCIIDTGSQASFISENLLKQISKDPLNRVETLPVSNMAILGILGTRSKPIRRQALIDFRYSNFQFPFRCLVIPHSSVPTILGVDFCHYYHVSLDFEAQVIKIPYENEVVQIPFLPGNKPLIKTVSSHITYIKEDTYKPDLHILNSPIETIPTDNQEMDQVLKNLQPSFDKEAPNSYESFSNLLKKHQIIFSDKPGLLKGSQARLNLKPTFTTVNRSYPIPYGKRQRVFEEIERMIGDGLIEPSNSPYTNPLVCVAKNDGNIRLCLDGRHLSKHIIPDMESPPDINTLLQKFIGITYMTSLDLTQSYLQIPLHKDDRPYVAFRVHGRNLQWTRLPFGLNVSGSIFIKNLNAILGPELYPFVTTYVDDILITSHTFEEHLEHLDIVLSKLKEHGATIRLSKSHFLKERIKFLGHIITKEGISMDPTKIAIIKDFQAPSNIKELQSFLGLINFYRKFNLRHSELTGQLNHLLRKNQPWLWTQTEEAIFNNIKDLFIDSVVLKHPDFTLPFIINKYRCQ
uniref:RNA-directed DNA polymerase n=1 Tax=Clastoptera arizonana TaxID=38151 RepID=A0A1B6DFS4_9HEMI